MQGFPELVIQMQLFLKLGLLKMLFNNLPSLFLIPCLGGKFFGGTVQMTDGQKKNLDSAHIFFHIIKLLFS